MLSVASGKKSHLESAFLKEDVDRSVKNSFYSLLVDGRNRLLTWEKLVNEGFWSGNDALWLKWLEVVWYLAFMILLSSFTISLFHRLIAKRPTAPVLTDGSFVGRLVSIATNASLNEKKSGLKSNMALGVDFADDIWLFDFISGCSLQSCRVNAWASKYMSVLPAIL